MQRPTNVTVPRLRFGRTDFLQKGGKGGGGYILKEGDEGYVDFRKRPLGLVEIEIGSDVATVG